jgi:hypothetical protein
VSATTHLITLQFHRGGQFGEPLDRHVHLVRAAAASTPGPTLCGVDRFDLATPGWSVGGGFSTVDEPCPTCAEVARRMRFTADLPIAGMHADIVQRTITAAVGGPRLASAGVGR